LKGEASLVSTAFLKDEQSFSTRTQVFLNQSFYIYIYEPLSPPQRNCLLQMIRCYCLERLFIQLHLQWWPNVQK